MSENQSLVGMIVVMGVRMRMRVWVSEGKGFSRSENEAAGFDPLGANETVGEFAN